MRTNCLAFEISHQLLKQFTTIEFKTLTMSVSCDRINEKNCKKNVTRCATIYLESPVRSNGLSIFFSDGSKSNGPNMPSKRSKFWSGSTCTARKQASSLKTSTPTRTPTRTQLEVGPTQSRCASRRRSHNYFQCGEKGFESTTEGLQNFAQIASVHTGGKIAGLKRSPGFNMSWNSWKIILKSCKNCMASGGK